MSEQSTPRATKYITLIRTTDGDMQIDYNALANLPTSLPANGGNANTLGGHNSAYFATAASVETLKEQVDSITVDATLAQEGVAADAKAVGDALKSATTLKNMFAGGVTVLSSNQYGTDDLSSKPGVVGQIYFKKVQ